MQEKKQRREREGEGERRERERASQGWGSHTHGFLSTLVAHPLPPLVSLGFVYEVFRPCWGILTEENPSLWLKRRPPRNSQKSQCYYCKCRLYDSRLGFSCEPTACKTGSTRARSLFFASSASPGSRVALVGRVHLVITPA